MSKITNLGKLSIDELLLKSKEGDSKAFSELSSKVRNTCYSYFYSKYRLKKINYIEDVEDLTNNVYMDFARKYQEIEEPEKWLSRVLFLTFIKWYKRRKITQPLPDSLTYDGGLDQKTNSLDIDLVLKILDQFSNEKQEIIKLRFWGGLRFDEIAEKLNKNETAVKKMYYRTLIKIREKMK